MNKDKAFKFCQKILKKVSRSFALTIPLLDDDLYTPILVAYLQDRLLDNFEDEAKDISLEQRKYYMDQVVEIFTPDDKWPQGALREIKDQADLFSAPELAKLTKNAHLLREANENLSQEIREISYYWLKEMNQGMQDFLTREVRTFAELDEYCYYVAGTVGGFLSETIICKGNIAGKKKKTLRSKFKPNGLFLQKVNIIRDIKKDAEQRNKIYWPLDSLGITRQQLLDVNYKSQAMEALEEMITDVLGHVPDLLTYYQAIPDNYPGYQRFFALNNALGLATLEKIRHNSDLFYGKKKVKVGKLQFLNIRKSPRRAFVKKCEEYV